MLVVECSAAIDRYRVSITRPLPLGFHSLHFCILLLPLSPRPPATPPPPSQRATISVREDKILFKTEVAKAIITHNKAILIKGR
jgi:hypothetical protein